jgi:hypothetical protein
MVVLFVVAPGMAAPWVTMIRMAVVMDFPIGVSGGVATAIAAPVGRLRDRLADDCAKSATDTATNNGPVAPTHRITDDGPCNCTNPAADGCAKGICTRSCGEEKPGKKKRENQSGCFHDAHLLDRVEVCPR